MFREVANDDLSSGASSNNWERVGAVRKSGEHTRGYVASVLHVLQCSCSLSNIARAPACTLPYMTQSLHLVFQRYCEVLRNPRSSHRATHGQHLFKFLILNTLSCPVVRLGALASMEPN